MSMDKLFDGSDTHLLPGVGIDLDALERAALAATPGPWYRDRFGAIEATDKVIPHFRSLSIACSGNEVRRAEANTNFIASANPAVVIELVRRLRVAEQAKAEKERAKSENAALREQLAAAQLTARSAFEAVIERDRLLAAVQKDAERYRVVLGDDLGTMREPLFNAKTGEELQDEVRWTIWWNGPNKPLIRDAIDAAIEKEKS